MERAVELVRATELEVRAIATASLQRGDYADGVGVAALAERLGALAAGGADGKGDEPPPLYVRGESHTASGQPILAEVESPARVRRATRSNKTTASFARQGDALVRVGKRRGGKGDYRHRIPLSIAERLAMYAGGWQRTGRLLTSEDFQAHAASDGEAVPIYQVYGVLKWFTALGVLRRHGRRGYSVTDPEKVVAAVRRARAKLPRMQEDER